MSGKQRGVTAKKKNANDNNDDDNDNIDEDYDDDGNSKEALTTKHSLVSPAWLRQCPVQEEDPEIEGLEEECLVPGPALLGCSGSDIYLQKSAAKKSKYLAILPGLFSWNNLQPSGAEASATAAAGDTAATAATIATKLGETKKDDEKEEEEEEDTVKPEEQAASSKSTNDMAVDQDNNNDSDDKKPEALAPKSTTDEASSSSSTLPLTLGRIQHLDSPAGPTLSIPLPNGTTLELSGQRVETSSKFLVLSLQPKKGKVICRHIFDSAVIFGDARLVPSLSNSCKQQNITTTAEAAGAAEVFDKQSDNTVSSDQRQIYHYGSSTRATKLKGVHTSTKLASTTPKSATSVQSRSFKQEIVLDEDEDDDENDDDSNSEKASTPEQQETENHSSSEDEFRLKPGASFSQLEKRTIPRRQSRRPVKYTEDNYEEEDQDDEDDEENEESSGGGSDNDGDVADKDANQTKKTRGKRGKYTAPKAGGVKTKPPPRKTRQSTKVSNAEKEDEDEDDNTNEDPPTEEEDEKQEDPSDSESDEDDKKPGAAVIKAKAQPRRRTRNSLQVIESDKDEEENKGFESDPSVSNAAQVKKSTRSISKSKCAQSKKPERKDDEGRDGNKRMDMEDNEEDFELGSENEPPPKRARRTAKYNENDEQAEKILTGAHDEPDTTKDQGTLRNRRQEANLDMDGDDDSGKSLPGKKKAATKAKEGLNDDYDDDDDDSSEDCRLTLRSQEKPIVFSLSSDDSDEESKEQEKVFDKPPPRRCVLRQKANYQEAEVEETSSEQYSEDDQKNQPKPKTGSDSPKARRKGSIGAAATKTPSTGKKNTRTNSTAGSKRKRASSVDTAKTGGSRNQMSTAARKTSKGRNDSSILSTPVIQGSKSESPRSTSPRRRRRSSQTKAPAGKLDLDDDEFDFLGD